MAARVTGQPRPPIDLDLGPGLSYGYRQPSAVVVEGPPHLLDPWPSVPVVAVSIVHLLSEGTPLTTDDLAERLELTEQRDRYRYLMPALYGLARRGRVRPVPGPPGRTRPYSWRLAVRTS